MTLGNVKTSKPLTVDVNTTIFLSTMRSSPGKCPVDVILKPCIHLKIAANLYTHNPCLPYHSLMAATSLSGT